MIRVVIRNNVSRQSVTVAEGMTLGEFLDQNEALIDQSRTAMLNGITIDASMEAKTFASLSNGLDTVYLSYTKNSEGN